MSHKFSPQHFAKLDNPWRRNILPPEEVLHALGLRATDRFADIGCGVGYFTLAAAEIIDNKSKLYGLDISDLMLKELHSRAIAAEKTNLELIQTDEYDMKLPDGSVSYALVVNVLHEVDDQSRLILELSRILDKESRLSIIEWEKKPMDNGPPVDHRLAKEAVIALLESNGFSVLSQHDFSGVFYGIVASKNPQ